MRVVNLRSMARQDREDESLLDDDLLIRIDRGTALGNPFRMKDESQREEVIRRYKRYLWEDIKVKGPMYKALRFLLIQEAKGLEVLLGCWCAPKECHGDVIVAACRWLNQQDEQEMERQYKAANG